LEACVLGLFADIHNLRLKPLQLKVQAARHVLVMWRNIFFGLLLGLIILQLLDVVVHVATKQVEVVRIVGSVLVILWAIALAVMTCAGKTLPWKASVAACVLIMLIYLVLNIIFLAEFGPMNEGRPRIPLFGFVLLTLGLAACGGRVHVKDEVQGIKEVKEEVPPQTIGGEV